MKKKIDELDAYRLGDAIAEQLIGVEYDSNDKETIEQSTITFLNGRQIQIKVIIER